MPITFLKHFYFIIIPIVLFLSSFELATIIFLAKHLLQTKNMKRIVPFL
jgi:hypothetical protein